eukprot:9476586-Pyramimonas_sp.AAC.1
MDPKRDHIILPCVPIQRPYGMPTQTEVRPEIVFKARQGGGAGGTGMAIREARGEHWSSNLGFH